jgi:hypothetical protein
MFIMSRCVCKLGFFLSFLRNRSIVKNHVFVGPQEIRIELFISHYV